MELKPVLLGILATISFIGVIASANLRAQRLDSHENSLFVRDVMRLAKAGEMRNYMNESVNPCVDFYEFACGNWGKVNPTVRSTETGYFYQIVQGIQRKKLALLRSNASTDAIETTVEKKVKDFYKSCIKAEDVKQSAYKNSLLKVLAEFGTMPALHPKSWNETQFDWLGTVAEIKKAYGISIILASNIMGDIRNNTINRLYIGPPLLHLEVRSMYLDDRNKEYREKYKDAIKKELIGALELSEVKAVKIASEVLNFEIELAKGLPDKKSDSSARETFVATTVEEMQQNYAPEIDIGQYLLNYFGDTIQGIIYETEKSYQENLVKVINATTKETLANYIFYQLITSFVPDETGKGAKRMKYCELLTEGFFEELMENMVYRRFDFRRAERDINLIFSEIRNAFNVKFHSNQLFWMSQSTRASAIKKLAATKFEITSYMHLNFTAEYGELEISDSNFFENIVNAYRNLAKNTRAELYQPKPKKPVGLAYTPVFSHMDNTIKIPVALLQRNYFWAHSYPNALKFGSIGALMGHEFVHGFADQGQHFDDFGNKVDWWDASSLSAFQNRIDCFKKQYHGYTFGDIVLPLVDDQSENVADNGGLRLAYEAYTSWHAEAERAGDDLSLETLPLLKYDAKKLFFLSFAQVWCNKIDSSFHAKKIATDEHTIAKFRVIGTLSNFDEFSKAFECEPNDRMNPRKKCVIY